MRLSFGDWTLNEGTRQLLARGEPQHLSPKAFELLQVLLRNRPRALSKAELHDALWPETHVSESALQTLVAELRSLLGDDARRPRYVRTVRGFGYAFQVTSGPGAVGGGGALSGETSHRLQWAKREVELSPGENILGRSSDVAIWIDSSSVSRRHARITLEDGRVILEDLGSKNGTFWRDQSLTEPKTLVDGEAFRLGQVWVTYRQYRGGETETD